MLIACCAVAKVGDVDLIARPLGLQAQLTCALARILKSAPPGQPATLDAGWAQRHQLLSASAENYIPFEFTVDGAWRLCRQPTIALNSNAQPAGRYLRRRAQADRIPAFLVMPEWQTRNS